MQLRTDAARSTDRGFTLIEIMVVVVIIGLLATLVGPRIWLLLREGEHKIAQTKAQEYYNDVMLLRTLTKRPVVDLAQLEQPIRAGEKPLQKLHPDPWGGAYQLEFEGDDCRVVSPGPDGVAGTYDDIAYPPRE